MKYKCSMCEHIFEQSTAPTSCPECKGEGKARYPKRLPAKRVTNKQRRAARAKPPAGEQGYCGPVYGKAFTLKDAEDATPEPPPGMIYGSCHIKL